MAISERERLEREIRDRQARLAELNQTVTREQLSQMTVQQIAALPPEVIDRALEESDGR
jgi:hypothetical protein